MKLIFYQLKIRNQEIFRKWEQKFKRQNIWIGKKKENEKGSKMDI